MVVYAYNPRVSHSSSGWVVYKDQDQHGCKEDFASRIKGKEKKPMSSK